MFFQLFFNLKVSTCVITFCLDFMGEIINNYSKIGLIQLLLKLVGTATNELLIKMTAITRSNNYSD